jgi:L-2-hydroxyglutarate oxidase LhgO
MDTVEVVVIGAGVVGLACARALARAGREVVILERETTIGSGISSRNSEVIHAGIYYPKGSLKARLCVEGRDALYAHCGSRGVPHKRLGKIIVAADEAQVPTLEKIRAAAEGNGVADLAWLSGAEARALEPELRAAAALLSPSTGIVDSHALMLSYLGEAEDYGAAIAYGATVEGGELAPNGVVLRVAGEDPFSLEARLVVNSAGLDATAIARRIEGFPEAHAPRMQLAKGSYFTLAGRTPFSRLVYPVPEPGGLGVHITLDLAGRARFGPDVEWIESVNYDVDIRRSEKFYAAVRSYWPGLKDGALTPAYSGVRPKLGGPKDPAADFVIQGPETHGVGGVINLFGIESPGLTASLAIAAEVERRAGEMLG